jgi:hypothetical protein
MRREVRADTRGYLFRASLSQDRPVRGSCFAFSRRLVVRDRVASSLATLVVAPVPVLLLSANLSPFPALETGADILVGISRRENERNWNEALLFTADGQVITYGKHRMIPGIERAYQPGNTFTRVTQSLGIFGLLIC